MRNPNTNNSVYGVVFDYYNANVTPIESFICAFDADGNKIANSENPYQAGAYNTTVFVKIGDVIVGKRVNRVFEIKQETINLSWEWTDSLGENIDSAKNKELNRTSDALKFIYNRAEQGLNEVTFAYAEKTFKDPAWKMFTLTGNGTFTTENGKLRETNASSDAYFRTYTLDDTRNFKIHLKNTKVDLSGTTVTFEWIIRQNKLYITNLWTSKDVGSETDYVFEYNAAHQGIIKNNGITVAGEPDTAGKEHIFDEEKLPYTITPDPYNDTIDVRTYTRTLTLTDTNNYIIVKEQLYSREVTTRSRKKACHRQAPP